MCSMHMYVVRRHIGQEPNNSDNSQLYLQNDSLWLQLKEVTLLIFHLVKRKLGNQAVCTVLYLAIIQLL